MGIEKLNNENTVIIICKGHSASRVIARTIRESGVFIGKRMRTSYDLRPVKPLYEAARIFGQHVKFIKDVEWSFSKVQTMEIPKEFVEFLEIYLKELLELPETVVKGWKLPETNLIYPWIVRLLPNAKYIHWLRHPKYCMSRMHKVDKLKHLWNVACNMPKNIYVRSLISWKYHLDIVNAVEKPKNFLRLKFEDFVIKKESLEILSEFLEREIICNFALDKSKLDYSIAFPYDKDTECFLNIIKIYEDSNCNQVL